VETELILADLESAERRLEAATRAARGGDKQAVADAGRWTAAAQRLRRGERAGPGAGEGLLTAKPSLVVANVAEGSALPPALAERGALAVCALDEAELGELEPADAAAMRAELGLEEQALEAVVSAAYGLLGLITFFTAVGEQEVRAWSLLAGSTARDAAGRVHTDMREGFVRAEAIAWDQLVECGSFAAARERGLLRTEGRDYVVADGEVLTIRFTGPRG
jgi:ribosome-binding ATPase YchF (GTP1/OBG family)